MKNKDLTTFVSWKDVFHPEQGVQYLHPSSRSENAVGAVFAEAWYVTDEWDPSSLSSNQDHLSIPVAQPVSIDEHIANIPTTSNTLNPQNNEHFDMAINGTITTTMATTPTAMMVSSSQDNNKNQYTPNLLERLVGGSLLVAAVASAFGLDLASLIVYGVAAMMYLTARSLEDVGGPLMLIAAIFSLTTSILLMVDSFLLILNVMITEIIAGLAFFLCSCLGRCKGGSVWHQHVRKMSHLTRWGIRTVHDRWEPHRIYPFNKQMNEAKEYRVEQK